MRVAVIGNSGSGKSTLAQQLAEAHALTALDLDTVAWEPGTIAVPRRADVLLAQCLESCRKDMPLGMHAIALLSGPLAAKDVLFTFYSRERLMSAIARAGWMEPDLGPITVGGIPIVTGKASV